MSELSWLLEIISSKETGFLVIALVFAYLWWRSERERIESQRECRNELKELLAKYEDNTNRATSSLVNVSVTLGSVSQFLFSRKAT